MFRPGVAIQARELTQIQTMLQDQIASIGNYLFKDGSKVPGIESSTISINDKVRSVRLQELFEGATIDVENFLNLWVTGETTDIVGQVIAVYKKDDPSIGDPPTVVVSYSGGKYNSENNGEFRENETLYFFDDRTDAVNRLTSSSIFNAVTESDVIIRANGTLLQGADEITFAVGTEDIQVGDLVTNPSITEPLYVTAIETNNRISLSGVGETTITNSTFTFIRRNSQPSLVVTVDSGRFYKYGIFIKSLQQSIVPQKYTAHPSKALIYKFEQSIVTAEDDESLLDPAVGSTNYYAPGADRYKIYLRLQAIDLDSADKTDTESEFIEIMRFVEGRRYINNANTDRTGLRTELARRTFDESGNYVVKPFTIDPIQVAFENENVKLSISPGTAYVGGYEVTTISPTFIELPKARTSRIDEAFNVNTNYGNYLIINEPSGGLINEVNPGKFNVLECHSVLNPVDQNSLIGYLYAKHLEYNEGTGFGATYKLYWYAFIPAGPDATPLSWIGFSNKYDIPVAEAQYISQVLYESNELLAQVNGQDVYGLFREPDVGGLAYWTSIWKENSENINLVKDLFAAAVLDIPGDAERAITQSKTFLRSDNSSPFYDDQFAGNIDPALTRSLVAVDNVFNPNGFTYASPAFKATIADSGRDIFGNVIYFEPRTADRMFFPIGRAYVKDVTRISTQYSKTLFDQQFSNGQLSITLGAGETFAAADGVLAESVARQQFIMVCTNQQIGDPLSWTEFEEKYNIPVSEAQYVSSQTYESDALLYTDTNTQTLYYGLYREPDTVGLRFWWIRWKNLGADANALAQVQQEFVLQAINDNPTDAARALTPVKTFLESNNGSPFYNTEYLDDTRIGRNFVPVDTAATVTISNGSKTATIQLTDTAFNGLGDIIFVVDNDDTPIRTKEYQEGFGQIVDMQLGQYDYPITYADINKIHGVFLVNQNDTYAGTWNISTTFQVNDIVYYQGLVYRALSAGQGIEPPTDPGRWERLTSESLLDYYFDNGQRDNFYTFGALRWLGEDSDAPGRVLLVFDYYEHTGIGPITVNSYPEYDTIPVYLSSMDGRAYNMRDMLDFRPVRDNSDTFFMTMKDHIKPNPLFLTECDVEYYLGRKDRLYITNKETSARRIGERFFIDQGVPDLSPKSPRDSSDSTQMLLATLYIPPYTTNSDYIKIIPNKIDRYTMKQIGDIDRRLNTLEKRVRRQGLEIIALSDVITNGEGKELYKSGVFVDNFETRTRANIYSPRFKAWIDVDNRECKPPVIYNTIEYATVNTNSFFEKSNLVMLPFTEEPFISQRSVTVTLNPNPGGLAVDPVMVITPTSTAEPGTQKPQCDDNLFEDIIGRTDRGDLGSLGSVGISCDRGGILGIVGDVVDFTGDVVQAGIDIAGDIADGIIDVTSDIVDGAVDVVSDIADGIGDFVGGIFGKVICTAMNETYGFGMFRNRVWLAYSAKHLKPEHEIGYHAIFLPLVKYGYYSDKKTWSTELVKNIVEHLCRHRTIDLRAIMHKNKKLAAKRDILGMIYRFIFEPTCYVVGKMILLKRKYFDRKK